ncbi:MAG: hypothetical protein ACYCQI_15725 [Gammaproteobacteria bacterium]
MTNFAQGLSLRLMKNLNENLCYDLTVSEDLSRKLAWQIKSLADLRVECNNYQSMEDLHTQGKKFLKLFSILTNSIKVESLPGLLDKITSLLGLEIENFTNVKLLNAGLSLPAKKG